MKRIVLLLLLAITLPALAQQAFDRSKMSDYLCSLVCSPSARQMKSVKAKQPAVTILMKLNDGDIHTVAESNGCQVIDSIGHIYIVRTPIAHLGQLSLDNRVMRIDAHEMPRPTMNETPTRVGAVKAWNGESPLPQAFTGEGVIAGVVDIGFDFTHPMFSDSLGYTRILQYMDMTRDSNGVAQYKVYDSEVLMDLHHSSQAKSKFHGTHVASIMTGSSVIGSKAQYSGIAPKSDIIMSEIGMTTLDLRNEADGTSANLILAYKHIFDYANEQDKPCVINYSGAQHFPLSDPCVLENKAIQELVGPGRIIVAGIGNNGQAYTTLEKPLGTDIVAVGLTNDFGQGVPYSDFCLETDGSQKIDFEIGFRNVSIKTDSIDIFDNKYTYIHIDSVFYDDYYDIEAGVDLLVYRVPDILGVRYNNVYRIFLDYQDVIKAMYGDMHLFGSVLRLSITSNNPCIMYANPHCYSFKPLEGYEEYLNHSHTFGWPAESDDVIAVGAINNRKYLRSDGRPSTYEDYGKIGEYASFSSQGPTWDNRIKPDVVAPGVSLFAARNRFYRTYFSYDTITVDNDSLEHLITAETGTSMSSPVVAGAIALWLQAKPDLTPTEIKKVLAKTCSRPDTTEVYPNNRYGYGEIDVYRGLLCVLGLPDKINNLSVHQPASLRFQLDGRRLNVIQADTSYPLTEPTVINIYATDGRKMASASGSTIDLSHLPTGVYAVQVTTGNKNTTGSTLIRL